MVKDYQEAANLLIDLLSKQKIEMIAKRLKIAKLLLKGNEYNKIRKTLKVGNSTIARVNTWLSEAGVGYRLVAEKGKDIKIPDWQPLKNGSAMPYSWGWLKKKYPVHFWPQLLLEEIVRSANNKQ